MSEASIDRTSVSMAAASASTLIGFSVTALTLLLALKPAIADAKAFYWGLVFFVVAVAFFAVAVEFYISAAWQATTYQVYVNLGLEGSASYGFGIGWLAVALGLLFLALMDDPLLPYFPPGLFALGLLVFYLVRSSTLGRTVTPPPTARIILRVLLFAQLMLGTVFIWLIQTAVI